MYDQNPKKPNQPDDDIDDYLSRYTRKRVREEAQKQGVDPDLAERQFGQESAYKPDVIKGQRRSSAGAIGAGQLMPGTAKDLGVDPYHIDENISGSVRYMKQQLDAFGGDKAKAAAAYNWGPGNVKKYGLSNAPAETRSYVKNVAGQQKDDVDEFLSRWKEPPASRVSPFDETEDQAKARRAGMTPAQRKEDRRQTIGAMQNELVESSRIMQQPTPPSGKATAGVFGQSQRQATADAKKQLTFRPPGSTYQGVIEEDVNRLNRRAAISPQARQRADKIARAKTAYDQLPFTQQMAARALATISGANEQDVQAMARPDTLAESALAQPAQAAIRGTADIVRGVGELPLNPMMPYPSNMRPVEQVTKPAAAAINRGAGVAAPIVETDKGWLTAKIPAAIGSAVPFIAGNAATGGGAGSAALLGALGSLGQYAEQIDQSGQQVSPMRRASGQAVAMAQGLTEAFGLGRVLDKFGVKQPAVTRIAEMLEEAGQEYVQQYLEDINAKLVAAYDQSRDLSPFERNKLEAAALGAIVGGAFQGGSAAAESVTGIPERRQIRSIEAERAPMRGIAPSVPAGTQTQVTKLTPEAARAANQPVAPSVTPDIANAPTEPLTEPLATPPSAAISAPSQPNAPLFPAAQQAEQDISQLQGFDKLAALEARRRGTAKQTPEQAMSAEFERLNALAESPDESDRKEAVKGYNRLLTKIRGSQQYAAETRGGVTETPYRNARQVIEQRLQGLAPKPKEAATPAVASQSAPLPDLLAQAEGFKQDAAAAEQAGNFEAAAIAYQSARDILRTANTRHGKTMAAPDLAALRQDINLQHGAFQNAQKQARDLQRQVNKPTAGLPQPRRQAAQQPPPLMQSGAIVNPEGGIPAQSPKMTFTEELQRGIDQSDAARAKRKPQKRLLSRIAELGGIDKRYAGELRDVKDARRIGVIRDRAQMSPDILARQLQSEGYDVDPDDLNTLWEAARRDISDERGFRPADSAALDRRLAEEEAAYYEKVQENEQADTGRSGFSVPLGESAEQQASPTEGNLDVNSISDKTFYHGTSAEIAGLPSGLSWFTTSKKQASDRAYTPNNSGRVHVVRLNVRHPYKMRNEEAIERVVYSENAARDIQRLKDLGYDGLMTVTQYDRFTKNPHRAVVVIPFDNSQIQQASHPQSQQLRQDTGGLDQTEGTPAQVKMMLTRDDRQQLLDLGYSRSDIDAMSPAEGQQIITEGRTKGNRQTEPDSAEDITPEDEGHIVSALKKLGTDNLVVISQMFRDADKRHKISATAEEKAASRQAWSRVSRLTPAEHDALAKMLPERVFAPVKEDYAGEGTYSRAVSDFAADETLGAQGEANFEEVMNFFDEMAQTDTEITDAGIAAIRQQLANNEWAKKAAGMFAKDIPILTIIAEKQSGEAVRWMQLYDKIHSGEQLSETERNTFTQLGRQLGLSAKYVKSIAAQTNRPAGSSAKKAATPARATESSESGERAKPAETGRIIQHSQFGEVRESADQSGVAKGKLRVVDGEGTEHVIQNPRTSGNRSAAFAKSEKAEAEPEPQRLNFTQFANKRGLPSDYDVVDHSLLSPAGRMSARSRKSAEEKQRQRAAQNQQAHAEFEAAIRRGEIVDATGKTTKESLERADRERQLQKIQSRIATLDSQIRFIESLGAMSHLPDGSLKKKYQRTVDNYNAEKTKLLDQRAEVLADYPDLQPKDIKPAESPAKPAEGKPASDVVKSEKESDYFEIQRLDPQTDTFRTDKFQRGEYVKAWLGGSGESAKYTEGVITGISHANGQVQVTSPNAARKGGVWHPFGTIYKTEQPKPAEKPKVKLSKVIEQSNKRQGVEFTEADRVPSRSTADVDALLAAGTITPEQAAKMRRKPKISERREAPGAMPERYTGRQLFENARVQFRPARNRPATLVANDWGGAMMNRLLSEKYGESTTDANFTIAADDMQELRDYLAETKDSGIYDEAQTANMDALLAQMDAAIKDAKANNQDVAFVTRKAGEPISQTKIKVRHETAHVSQSRVTPDMFALTERDWLGKQPEAAAVRAELERRGYPPETHAHESAVFVASGDFDAFGINLDQATKFLSNYFNAVVQKHGRRALDRFGAIDPRLQPTLERARNEKTEAGQAANEQRSVSYSPGTRRTGTAGTEAGRSNAGALARRREGAEGVPEGASRKPRTRADVENSPEFKRWFGDSVVTENGKAGGKPLVVYHGTPADFDAFRPGSYFTADPEIANEYGESVTYPAYLRVKNPYQPKALKDLREIVGDSIEDYNYLFEALESKSVRAAIQSKGYDGVIFQDVAPDSDGGRQHQAILIFSPTQIKSAFNRGTFDPQSPKISERKEGFSFGRLEKEPEGQIAAAGLGAFQSLFGKKPDLNQPTPEIKEAIPADFNMEQWRTRAFAEMFARRMPKAERKKYFDQFTPKAEKTALAKKYPPTDADVDAFADAMSDAIDAYASGDGAMLREQLWRVRHITQPPATNSEKASALMRASMFSRPVGRLRDVISNAAFQKLETAARIPGGAADAFLSLITGRRAYLNVAPKMYLKHAQADRAERWKQAKDVLKGKHTDSLEDILQHREVDFNNRLLDKSTKAIFRAMGAADQLYFVKAYRRALREFAEIQARQDVRGGIIGKADKEAQRDRYISAPSVDMKAMAEMSAKEAVFRNPNFVSDFIQKARENMPPGANFALDIVLPVDKTPTNIIFRALEYSPLGIAKAGGQAVLAAGRTARNTYRAARDRKGIPTKQEIQKALDDAFTVQQQRAMSQLIGRSLTGSSSLVALGFALASKGLATGFYDEEDRKAEARRRAEGAQPGSIKILGRWWDLSGIAPMGTLITLGATLHREMEKEASSPEERYKRVAKGFADMVTDIPLLESAKTTAKIAKDATGKPAELGRFAGNVAARFVPGFVSDIGQAIPGVHDPYEREVKAPKTDRGLRKAAGEFGREIGAKIPGVRRTLPIKRNAADEEMTTEYSDVIDPFRSRPAVPAASRRGFKGQIFDMGLDPQFSEAMQRKKGEPESIYQKRRERVSGWMNTYGEKLVNHPMYNLLTSEQKQKAIENLRARVGRQMNMVKPNERTLEPQEVIKAVRQAATRKPRRGQEKMWEAEN